MDGTSTGLSALQTAFLKECTNRLCAPLEYLFPEAVSVDENGIAIPCLPTLPSRYDLAKIDANIREELSLADPRQGGGDFSMATMLGEVVVVMLHKFCVMARRAVSEGGEEKMLDSRPGSVSEAMAHKLSVAGVMVCILRLLICNTTHYYFHETHLIKYCYGHNRAPWRHSSGMHPKIHLSTPTAPHNLHSTRKHLILAGWRSYPR